MSHFELTPPDLNTLLASIGSGGAIWPQAPSSCYILGSWSGREKQPDAGGLITNDQGDD